MNLCLKYKLLAVFCFTLPFKSLAQVEFSGLIGPVFHYASVKHAPDSAGTESVNAALAGGMAATLEANVPLQHGFRLKAGMRFLYKIMTFEQDFKLPWARFENHWHLQGFALETPVHLTYLVVDRRFQITVGAGMAVVKNWLQAGHTGISGSGSSGYGSTSSYYIDIMTSGYQAEKNNVSLAGKFSVGITPSFWPNFGLEITGHQDLINKVGRISYENQYGVQAGSSPVFRSKGSFGIERPGYFMVQLKYTFAGKPKIKETEREPNFEFEEEGSE